MKNSSRLLMHIASIMLLFVTGCDSSTAPATDSNAVLQPSRQIISTSAPITGIWSAVVTDATDLNNASFGRDASDWIGRTVTGAFSIHLTAPGIGDRNPAPNVWEFGPVPGPGPFIEFVTVTALIDGQTFKTSSAEFQGVFFGDVVGILTSNVQSSFNLQDSHVGFNAAGIGRNIVGFDTNFSPGGVSFDGTTLTIDPSRMVFGQGLIDDLFGNGATVLRQGTINFRVTRVSLSPAGTLLESVIELLGLHLLQPNQVTALVDKLNEIALKFEAGNARAACNQLGAFLNQVRAFINSGPLTATAGQSLIDEVQSIMVREGC